MNPITMQLIADKYIHLTLEEGISSENISTSAVVPEYKEGQVQFTCREDGIIAGLQIFKHTFTLLDPEAKVIFDVRNGEQVKKGQHLATVTGNVHVLLPGKRTALSYLQCLSGIATYTHTVVRMFERARTKLLDTRKTTPCIRIFERHAVRIGGGQSHRYNLSDGVLLKDNHIDTAEGVREAAAVAKAYTPFIRKIEVETENLDMVKDAVDASAGIIVLDNVTPEQMIEAIRLIDGRTRTECSGDMTKKNIRAVTELGVDCVSSGALTRSALILDINLKHLKMLTD